MLIKQKKYLLILGKGSAQGLDDTTLTAEKEYNISFIEEQQIFCLSLHYNLANSNLFLNSAKIYKQLQHTASLCLGNILKDFSADNTEKTALYGYVSDFLVGQDSADVADILDIHKY